MNEEEPSYDELMRQKKDDLTVRILRMLDEQIITNAHIEQQEQTIRSQKGMLKKQGREIVALRRQSKKNYSGWQASARALSDHTMWRSRAEELLWQIAGRPKSRAFEDARENRLTQAARLLLRK